MTAVALGDNCIDRYLAPVDREFIGGQAVNVAVGLAAQGMATAYAGVIGRDEAGERIVTDLARRGVDVSAVERANGPTGLTVIASEDGERYFVTEEYGVSAPYSPGADALSLTVQARLVYAAHISDMAALADALPPRVELAVDVSDGTADDPTLARIGILFVSRPWLEIDGAQAEGRLLASRGVRLVVVTLGARGAVAISGDTWAATPAPTVSVVDTLGAGDAFAAGFLAGHLDGLDLQACLVRGSGLAAEALGHWGALPPLE